MPQMRSQEAQIAEINSTIYIMHKDRGATLIMMIKKPDKLNRTRLGQ